MRLYPDYVAHLSDEPWQFYILGVWVRKDGYYISTDSGCSCPSWWENHTEDDLTGPLTFEQLVEEATSLAAVAYYSEFASAEVSEMLSTVASNYNIGDV